MTNSRSIIASLIVLNTACGGGSGGGSSASATTPPSTPVTQSSIQRTLTVANHVQSRSIVMLPRDPNSQHQIQRFWWQYQPYQTAQSVQFTMEQ